MFPSGKTGTASATARPRRARKAVIAAAARPRPIAHPDGIERQSGCGPDGVDRREHGAARTCGRLRDRRGRRPRARARALHRGAAKRGRELRRRRPARRVQRERAVDELQQALRQVGPQRRERRGAELDRARRVEHRRLPERMPARERLPQHHADGPDVCSGLRVVARQPLGRDVGERSRHVALRGQGLRLGHPREPEVEQPRRDPVAFGQQDVRRLDVAVEDPGRVGMRKSLAHLSAGLDRVGVGQLPRAKRLPEGAARDELVGDVDVSRVAGEGVGPQAAGMPELRGGGGLALRARGGLALAGDDLQGDVEARLLVTGEPDRPRAAAPERSKGPVSVENEPVAFERERSVGHGSELVGGRRVISSTGEPRSTVWADLPTV